jgi:hypothetical protein
MKPDQIIRSSVSSAMSVTAKVLSVAAEVTTAVARRARPGRSPQGRSARVEQQPATPEAVSPEQLSEALPETEATVSPPPTEPVPDGPSHVRTAETHAEELALKPASQVIEAVAELSTDELGRLYEHEAAHKKRKTVLKAIEKALTPADGSRHSPSPEPMPEAGGVPTGGGDGTPRPADAR